MTSSEDSGTSSRTPPPDSSPDFLAMISLLELRGLMPPTFPTFSELARISAEPERRPETGLFDALLGNPEILFVDYLEHPESYDDQTAELLQLLVGGARKLHELSPDDQQLLNRATVEFAQTVHPKPGSLTSPVPPTVPTPEPDDDEPELEYRDGHVGAPDTKNFWWAR